MEQNKISAVDASRLIGVSVPMIHYWITNGRIKPLGRFGGAYILDRCQIEALKREREREARR